MRDDVKTIIALVEAAINKNNDPYAAPETKHELLNEYLIEIRDKLKQLD